MKLSNLAKISTAVLLLMIPHHVSAQSRAKKTPPPATTQKPSSRPPIATPDIKDKLGDKVGDLASTRSAPRFEGEPQHFAVGLMGGWEAPYGNAITFDVFLAKFIDLQVGFGMNNSGFKAGGGGGIALDLMPSFGITALSSFVFSNGKVGKTSLDAEFTPEGTTTAEKVVATKQYKVSPATFFNVSAGIYFKLMQRLRLTVTGGYNKIIKGNDVVFEQDIEFDKNIIPTNEAVFNEKFEDKASSLVRAGGPGFALGAQFLF